MIFGAANTSAGRIPPAILGITPRGVVVLLNFFHKSLDKLRRFMYNVYIKSGNKIDFHRTFKLRQFMRL